MPSEDPGKPGLPSLNDTGEAVGSADAASSRLESTGDQFVIHARELQSVFRYAEARGVPQATVEGALDRFGLADVEFDGFDSFVSMNRFGRFLRHIGTLTDSPEVGLRIPDYSQPSSLGVLDSLVSTAPHFEQSMQVLCRYLHLYVDVAYVSFSVDKDRSALSWAYSPLVVVADVLADRAAALFVARMRRLFGNDFMPLSVSLARPTPVHIVPYRDVFGPNVRFGAAINSIAIAVKDLQRTNKIADPYAHEVALQLASRMADSRRQVDDVLVRVQEDVVVHLISGHANLSETARRLGMSERSLQRRLDEQETSYQRIVDEARLTQAKDMLAGSALPMGEIAYRLGFANQANFTRAVRRWFGASPTDVRQSARKSPQAR